MAIRLRVINGDHWIALCAARSVEKIGDVYLDDGQHYALTRKFAQDFNSEGIWPHAEVDQDSIERAVEESNNPNREEWERTFGPDADALCAQCGHPRRSHYDKDAVTFCDGRIGDGEDRLPCHCHKFKEYQG